MGSNDPQSLATAPKRPFSTLSKHHRRTNPSSNSVQSRKKVKIDQGSSNLKERSTSNSSPETANVPLLAQQESGSDESATKWFDGVNENVIGTRKNQSPLEEGESPFFLAPHSIYNPPGDHGSINAESFGHLNRKDSETEDLRGVIDDLTVENKRLKHLLKHKSGSKSTLSPSADKVLEIRMHGLPPNKKRDLEQLLKTFTLGLTPSVPSEPGSSHAVDTNGSFPNELFPKLQLPPGTISAIDSGYASNATSGVNLSSSSVNPRASEPVSQSHRDRNIKNYLHDIPNSLLPQGRHAIDENTKMALVVQRLEQLFLGKSAVPGEHSLPVQQQKISQSAARADRREDVKYNRMSRNGAHREAHMLSQDPKMGLDAPHPDHDHESVDLIAKSQQESGSASDSVASGSGHSCSGSPGQRPTRPLDLDIERAQVVEDNISYIRHLGFPLPLHDQSSGSNEQPWIYLNLLVGMAQLHTLNVTPAFIRKAVRKLSTRFEISKDEQRIRWKGDYGDYSGADPQQSPSIAVQRASEDAGDETGGTSRRSGTSTLNEQGSSLAWEELPIQSGNPKSLHSSDSSHLKTRLSSHPSKSSAFDYKPIVYRGKRAYGKQSYLDSPNSQGTIERRSIRSGRASSLAGQQSKNDSHEGVVTFFNNPYYCEDLSGDGNSTNWNTQICWSPIEALGMSNMTTLGDDDLRDAKTCYFKAGDDLGGRSEEAVEEDCPEITMSIDAIDCAGEDETQPIELPASGIGGVRPEENFALDVKVARTKQQVVSQAKLDGLRGSLGGIGSLTRFDYRVAGCEKLELQPSKLPPPSYVFFTSSSASSAGEELDSSGSSDTSSELEESPALAGYMWQWTSSSQENLGEEGAESDISSIAGAMEVGQARDGSSVQMPTQEGTYILDQAGRTVSGSLAATAGASWSAASLADRESRQEGDVEMQED
ncbi:uncharacterized protein A1O9_10143 [Exophiala aquamarina CBS 119918]|uniref:Frequency clock protein n=1 Tax=Exophiala aquamarina CBS 119918 TaxID=1182545 RepID=A0A072P233_9EURO|nr:uncharacterized protein A1O9_10143 [Exophiala aquamarina CBS 119918]KEF53742.1 hypothetical protein A1O9_10143 [Exophiala aquamarina CBS 119918]